MTVLVLAADLDPTVDAVVAELNRRDVPVLRCDLAWFPQHLALDARLDDGARRWAGGLHTEHRHVELEGLRSAWYRGPTGFRLPTGLTGPERHHALWEAKLGLGGVLAELPVLWVNHPGAEADAAYKPVQLPTATRSGLTVPPTLITNQLDAVRAFAADHDGDIVVKPLSFGIITEDGVDRPIWTHRLTGDDLADLSGVDTTAHLFQRYVGDKQFEARVTVVGGRLFAAAIHAGSAAARIDWRSDYAALDIKPVDVPAQVESGIREFMTRMELVFGAFDFVVDTSGAWWFLECNSAGQFGWIEDATGLPITAALADLLEKGQP